MLLTRILETGRKDVYDQIYTIESKYPGLLAEELMPQIMTISGLII